MEWRAPFSKLSYNYLRFRHKLEDIPNATVRDANVIAFNVFELSLIDT